MKLHANTAQSASRAGRVYKLVGSSEPEDPIARSRRAAGPAGRPDELPYKVELWDDAKANVEQVLAVTAHGSIGYAAYYAATREYPGRYVTLRHKNRTIARSIEAGH